MLKKFDELPDFMKNKEVQKYHEILSKKKFHLILKRIFDISVSIILLIPFILILIPITIFIWLEDKGPIFYNSNRLGKNGKIFKMYKFRSMKVNAPDIRNKDGSTFNSDNDERLTKTGKIIRKTSIDELPQILNVLKGDMSIVGPRPDLPEDIYSYKKGEMIRLIVLPGITGYSQAYYRNSIIAAKKIKNDCYYVKNFSIWFDIKIIIQTIKSVLKRDNIFQKNN